MAAAVRRRRAWFASAVMAITIGLVSACSANPEPAPLPQSSTPVETTTGTPRPAGDPTPSPDGPPTLPAAARGTSARAAEAFVRFWIESLNYAATTGETSGLRRSSTASCAACGAIARFIERTYQRSGHIEGDGWEPGTFKVVSGGTSGDLVVEVVVEVRPQVVIASPEAGPTRYPGGRRLKTFWLSRTHRAWLVDRLEQAT
ncbi:MAG TPA: DUF6318 family protein [Arthrobacter sp.]|nr:DUF6318 family protein [Arthrobacter sp.]